MGLRELMKAHEVASLKEQVQTSKSAIQVLTKQCIEDEMAALQAQQNFRTNTSILRRLKSRLLVIQAQLDASTDKDMS